MGISRLPRNSSTPLGINIFRYLSGRLCATGDRHLSNWFLMPMHWRNIWCRYELSFRNKILCYIDPRIYKFQAVSPNPLHFITFETTVLVIKIIDNLINFSFSYGLNKLSSDCYVKFMQFDSVISKICLTISKNFWKMFWKLDCQYSQTFVIYFLSSYYKYNLKTYPEEVALATFAIKVAINWVALPGEPTVLFY